MVKELSFVQSGKNEYTIYKRGGETTKKISKQTFDIILAIVEAKTHEHIDLTKAEAEADDMDNYEFNLKLMEAGL
jgi:hypothetical protein